MPATPLLIPRAGSVLEINAFPSTIVEAGTLIMRVGRLDTLWARVSLPPGQAFDPAARTASVNVGDAGLEATVIGVGTTASESTLQPTLMGKSWVFIEAEPNHFVRREITASAAGPDAWLTSTLKPGDKVVTVGPQLLLSEELKSLYSEGGD
jgi:hypothetical protein